MRGWQLKVEVGTGNKKIIPRLRQNVASDTVFRNIALNSVQWTVSGSIQKFFKIGKNAIKDDLAISGSFSFSKSNSSEPSRTIKINPIVPNKGSMF